LTILPPECTHNAQMTMRLLKSTLFIIVFSTLTASVSFAAEVVGKAAELSGKVMVTHEGEAPKTLEYEADILLKDVIETKKDGAVKISFKDGTDLALQAGSKIMISEFVYNPKKKERNNVVEANFGKVRLIVNKTFDKSKSKTEVKTPTAVVGVRGTDFALDIGTKRTKVFCLRGSVDTFNPLFPLQIVSIGAGMFSDVLAGVVPGLPIAIPAEILNQIQNQFGFPITPEGLKQKAVEELQRHVPIPIPGGLPF